MFWVFRLILFINIIDFKNTNCYGFEDIAWKSWNQNPWTWGDFLEEQYYETLKSLEYGLDDDDEGFYPPSRHQRSVDENTKISFQISPMTSDSFSDDVHSPAVLFHIADQSYILVNDNIYVMHRHFDGEIYLEFSHLIDNPEFIYAVETQAFEDSTYVLLIYKRFAEVLKIPKDRNRISSKDDRAAFTKFSRKYIKQRISSDGHDISKGKFFVYDGILYVFIVYNHCEANTKSWLYRWSGSHFNAIDSIDTESVINLEIVQLKESIGLIIVQNCTTGNTKSATRQMFILDHRYEGFKRLYNYPADGVVLTLVYRDTDHMNLDDQSYLTNILFVTSDGRRSIFTLSDDGRVVGGSYSLTDEYKNISNGFVSNLNRRNFIFLLNMTNLIVYSPDYIVDLKIASDSEDILAMDAMDMKDGRYVLFIISKDQKNIHFKHIIFKITEDVIVTAHEIGNLQKCFTDLEYMLNEKQLEIDKVKKQFDSLKFVNESLNILSEVNIVDSEIQDIDLTMMSDLKISAKDILKMAKDTQDWLDRLEELSMYLFVDDEPVKIKNNIEISGDFSIENFNASHVQMMSINSKPFTEDDFYIVEDGQHVPNELVDGKKIKTKSLFAPVFNDIIQNASVLSSLSAKNIFIALGEKINEIDTRHIVTSGYSDIITGIKSFQKVQTHDVHTERLGQEHLTPWLVEAINKETPTKHLKVRGDVMVEDLIVKKINGVDFKKFLSSVFLKGSQINVNGNLHIKSNLTINNLKTESLQNAPVHKFMTKITSQTITSKISIRNILVPNLDAELINGVDFARNVALIGRHNTIKTPTTIFNLDVLQDLILNCGSENETLCNIYNTKPEDLLQIYNGPVTIQGSLLVNDLKFGNVANFTVDSEEFRTDVESIFWVKNKNQVITHDVTFDKGITVPQLSVEVLNNHETNFLTFHDDLKDISLVFHNVSVRHDVTTDAEGSCNIVRILNETAVRKTGRYHLKGKKSFVNKLVTKSLNAKYVNQRNVLELLRTKSEYVKFKGDVYLEEAKVLGALQVYTDISADIVNGVKWSEFVKKSARINYPTYLETADFYGLVDGNVLKVENSPLLNVPNIAEVKELDVTVNGPAYIESIYGNEQINNVINPEELFKNVVRKDEPAIVKGTKTFLKDVEINEDFESEFIENIPFRKLMEDSLTRSDDQFVYGDVTLGDVKTDHLFVESINKIPATHLISIMEPEIVIKSDLTFDRDLIIQNRFDSRTSTPCELKEVLPSLNQMPGRYWNQVTVDGNLNWINMDEKIWRILDKAVMKNKDAVIDSEVISEKQASVKELYSTPSYADNQIQILIHDAVKKNSDTPQVIRGKMTFKNNLQASHATIDHLHTPTVNGYKVRDVNASLTVRNEQMLYNHNYW